MAGGLGYVLGSNNNQQQYPQQGQAAPVQGQPAAPTSVDTLAQLKLLGNCTTKAS